MEKTEENRGGARASSGRKPSKYKTKIISFRVRVELAEQIKAFVESYIKKLIKKEN